MLTVEYSLPDIEELTRLVEAGQEKGFLTYEEIATVLEEVEISKEQVEDLHSYLIDHGIDVLESAGDPTPDAPAAEKGPELDLTVEPSLDSLRLYLRAIGRVSLLTAEQEVMLAKRGAMGVFCCASALTGRGGALKVEDGAFEAMELAAVHLLEAVAGPLPEVFDPWRERPIRDGNGTPVGSWRNDPPF